MWVRSFAVLFELRARVLANYSTNIENILTKEGDKLSNLATPKSKKMKKGRNRDEFESSKNSVSSPPG